MLACPDATCPWTIQKTRLEAAKCYRCKADLSALLDPATIAGFATARATCNPATCTSGPVSTAAGTNPVAGNSGQPAPARSAQSKATTTAAAVVAAPWRAHRGIDAEKTQLQSLLAEADEQNKYCDGVVRASLFGSIAKSEAIIVALDTNSGGTATDRLGHEATLRQLQQ